MGQISNKYTTKDGIEITMESKGMDIDDSLIEEHYKIHGKRQYGLKLTPKEEEEIKRLEEEAKAYITIKNGENKIDLKFSIEEIIHFSNFLQGILNSMFTINQTDYDSILSQNNVFNRVSKEKQIEINQKLNEQKSTDKKE